MIWDRLSSIGTYRGLWPALDVAIDFIERTDLAALPLGKTVVEPDQAIAIRQEYASKPHADCKWEAHRVWADIQLVLSGQERFGYAPLETVTSRVAYNPEKDVELFHPAPEGDLMLLTPGRFGILLAHDVHMPGGVIAEPEPIVKVVFKVRLPGA